MEPGTDLSARVDELAAALARMEVRLACLEQRPPQPASAVSPVPEELPAAGEWRALDLAPVGQSVLALGGGYLLRAVTELDAVPDGLGALLGLVYAAALLALADRSLARGRRLAGALGAATALLCAYPLVGEMVLRFHVVPAAAGAVALLAWCAALVAIAAHRHAVAPAWIAISGTAAAALALGVTSHAPLSYLAALAGVAALALWLGDRLGQRLLFLPAAILGDLLLLFALPLILAGRALWSGAPAPAFALLYFLVFAGAALLRRGAPRATLLTQCAIAFVAGYGGGAWVAVVVGQGTIFGVVGLALAGAGTALTARRGPFWASLWWAAAMVALLTLTSGAPLGLAFAALGVGLVAARRLHPLAATHGVLALVAGAAASGLLDAALRGRIAPPAALAVLAALAAATVLLFRDGDRGRVALVTRLADLLVVFIAAGGLLATTTIRLAGVSAPAAATIRTAVLSLAAVVLAAASRSPRAWPAGLLVYPMLAAAAAKLLMQDFMVGTPLSQTVGLLVFGLALIVAPRLRGTAARSGGTRTG